MFCSEDDCDTCRPDRWRLAVLSVVRRINRRQGTEERRTDGDGGVLSSSPIHYAIRVLSCLCWFRLCSYCAFEGDELRVCAHSLSHSVSLLACLRLCLSLPLSISVSLSVSFCLCHSLYLVSVSPIDFSDVSLLIFQSRVRRSSSIRMRSAVTQFIRQWFVEWPLTSEQWETNTLRWIELMDELLWKERWIEFRIESNEKVK